MSGKKPLSFAFSKRKESKLVASAVGEKADDLKNDDDYVTSLENNKVKGTKVEPKEKEYIIPLKKKNDGVLERLSKTEGSTDTLEQAAIKEILQDAALEKDRWENRGKEKDLGLVVSMKNAKGETSEDKEQSKTEPAKADYEEIPIEQFGLAMLRGMGWKKDVGIGKTAKIVESSEATVRPKGLGLGADKSQLLQAKDDAGTSKSRPGADDDEKLVMKKGAYCVIDSGKHKGLYAEIEGVDEENCRVFVRVALHGESVSLSQRAVELVTKAHFKKNSHYINKAKVDEYKSLNGDGKHRSDDERHRSDKKRSHREKSQERRRSREREKSKERHRSRDRERRKHKDRSRSRSVDKTSKKKRRREEEASPKSSSSHKHQDSVSSRETRDDRRRSSSEEEDEEVQDAPWLYAGLKVRFIDENFKKGKYFKSKVVIEDVVSPKQCIVKTEDGRILEGIVQTQLETVIPRDPSSYVMILAGEYSGQTAKLLKKDKSALETVVQLVRNSETVLQLSFDEICEYVGSIMDE